MTFPFSYASRDKFSNDVPAYWKEQTFEWTISYDFAFDFLFPLPMLLQSNLPMLV